MILIIGAMPEEVNELILKMNNVQENCIFDIATYSGTIAGKDVVLAQSGVGKVNAAYTTATLLSNVPVTHVINIGSAGGLQTNQHVGDFVVATKLQYHDLDIGPETSVDERFIFDLDPTMLSKTMAALNELDMPYHTGLIVSGDQFITKTSSSFTNIQNNFPTAICVEMEATAIAHVCSRMKVPFVVTRGLSDIAIQSDNDLAFETYLHLASKKSASLCEALVSIL